MTERDTPLVSQSCNEEEFAKQSEKTLQGVGMTQEMWDLMDTEAK